jgi:hypothetical protein
LVEAEYVISQTQGKSDEALRAITMTVSQTDNVKSREAEFVAPEPKPIAMPVSKKVAPVEVAEDDFDEPVKVSKETAPAGKPDLLNLIDEWDQ